MASECGGSNPDTDDGQLAYISSMTFCAPLDEGTGSTQVLDIVSSRPGTLSGCTWVPGTSGAALQFDGLDDSVDFGSNTTAFGTGGTNYQFHLSADLVAGTNTAFRYGFAFSKWHTSQARQWVLGIYGPNAYGGKSANGTSGGWNSSTGTSTLGLVNWHHVGFQNNPQNKLYVNKILEFSDAYGNLYNGTASVRLGIAHAGAANATFLGKLDNVKRFNTGLSTNDMLWNASWPVITVGSATTIGSTTATVSGTATPVGTWTHAYIKYGTQSGSYTLTSYQKNIGTNTTATGFTRTLTSLTPETTIYYRVEAYTPFYNKVFGAEQSFTTIASADAIAPVGTVTVNSGGTYTTSTSVLLNLSATDAVGVTGYFLNTGSTTPYGTQSGWVNITGTTTYSNDVPYTFTSVDEVKNIYCWFKDNTNNISSIAQDSIILDTVFTGIAITSPTHNMLFSDSSKVFGTSGSSISLAGSSTDTNGVTLVQISNSATTTVQTATGTESWSKTITLVSGQNNLVSVTATDSAGNQGTDTIHLGKFSILTTGEAQSITSNSANIIGTVTNHDGNTDTVFINYGVAIYNESTHEYEGYDIGDYPGTSSTQNVAPPSTSVTIPIADLASNTQYRARLAVESDVGNTYAISELEFTTLSSGATLPSGFVNYPGWYLSTQGIKWLKDNGLWETFLENVRSSKDWEELRNDPYGYLVDTPHD